MPSSLDLHVRLWLAILLAFGQSSQGALKHEPEPEKVKNLKEAQEGKEKFHHTLGTISELEQL
jgi:hypothetical protein